MHRFLGFVAFALGGAVATLALTTPTPSSSESVQIVGARWHVLYDSPAATAAAGAIAAVVVAALLVRRVDGLAAAVAGLVTLVVVGATPSGALLARYTTTVAAGVALGGLCVMIVAGSQQHGRLRSTSLAAGAVLGYLAGQPLRQWWRGEFSTPRRYADYLPYTSGPPMDWVLIAGAVLAIIALAALATATRGESRRIARTWSVPAIVVGLVVPVAAVVAYWIFRESVTSIDDLASRSWAIGYVVLALALVGALVLPGRTGLAWVGVVAVVASVAAVHVDGDDTTVSLLVIAAMVAVGALLGRWRPVPLVGFAVLLVVLLARGFDAYDTELWAVAASVFGLPLASAYTMASLMPGRTVQHTRTAAPALAALASLAALSGGIAKSDHGWVSYLPLTGAGTFSTGAGYVDIDTDLTVTTAVILSGISLLACAVVTLLITRRPDLEPGTANDEEAR